MEFSVAFGILLSNRNTIAEMLLEICPFFGWEGRQHGFSQTLLTTHQGFGEKLDSQLPHYTPEGYHFLHCPGGDSENP